MANFVERISVLVDVKIDQASGAFKRLSGDIKAADGAVGKFKAGASSLGNSLGNLLSGAGGIPIIGGYIAGVATTSLKAADAFSDLSKEAIDLSKATGLSVEQASRWIAVGDDFQVTADQLQMAMLRLGKNMDSEKMSDYGIATRDAAGAARDANEIFLDVLTVLNNTKPAERAKVGAELLGKGWASIAPMLGKSRDAYEKMLDSVSAGQTITEDEAESAEEWRLAMDEVSDSLKDVQLELGKLVVELAPVIKGVTEFTSGALTKWVKTMEDAQETLATLKGAVLTFGYQLRNVMGPIISDETIGQLQDLNREFDAAHDAGDRGADGIRHLAAAFDAAHDAGDRGADGLAGFSQEARVARAEAAETEERVRGLEDALSDVAADRGALDVADQFDQLEQASKDAWYAAASGAEDAEQKQRDYEREVLNTKEEVAKYGTEILKLPPEKVTKLLTELDEGNFDYVEGELDRLTRNRTIGISANISYGGGHVGVGNIKQRHTGGRYNKGDLVLTGERGPELEVKDSGGYVFNADDTKKLLGGDDDGLAGVAAVVPPRPGSGSGGVQQHIHFHGSIFGDDRAVLDAITRAANDGVRAAWMAG